MPSVVYKSFLAGTPVSGPRVLYGGQWVDTILVDLDALTVRAWTRDVLFDVDTSRVYFKKKVSNNGKSVLTIWVLKLAMEHHSGAFTTHAVKVTFVGSRPWYQLVVYVVPLLRQVDPLIVLPTNAETVQARLGGHVTRARLSNFEI